MPATTTGSVKRGKASIVLIPRNRIRPFKGQPREFFNQEALRELAGSIEEVGQLTPVLVKKLEGDAKYDFELIAGQRRWHACEIAGVEMLRAEVVEVEDAVHQYLLSAIENFGRVDLSDIEAARTCARLKKDHDWTDERIGKALGKPREWVNQRISLLRLHPEVQAMLEPNLPRERQITFSFALRLVTLHPDLQLDIARTVVAKGMLLGTSIAYLKERVSLGGEEKKRQPRKLYQVLRSLFGGTLANSEAAAQLNSDNDLVSAFRYRPPEDHAKLVETGERALEALRGFLERIKNAKPQSRRH